MKVKLGVRKIRPGRYGLFNIEYPQNEIGFNSLQEVEDHIETFYPGIIVKWSIT